MPGAALWAHENNGFSATAAAVRITYRDPINREGSGLRLAFYGDKAATWALSLKLIDAADPTKWVRFDESGITGEVETPVSVADVTGSPDATGPGGAPDFRALGAIEIMADNDTFAAGDAFVIDDLDWFGGSLNGVVVDGGDLVNQEQGDPYWPTDDNLAFWGDDAEPFWVDTNYFPGIYEFEVEPDAASVPCDLRIEINDDVGVDYFLEYKVGDRFVAFPGILPVASTDPLRFRLRLAGGTVQGRVTDLAVIFDVEDEREQIEDFAVAASGEVRLPITKSYRSIRRVEIALLNAGTGMSWKLLDKNPITGPSIEVYNASGTRVAEDIDAFVEGVKGQ